MLVKRIRDFEYVNHFDTQSLNLNTKTTYGENLPLGQGWYRLNFRFNNVLTVGTGTGAIAEGELHILKNLLIRTSRGEILCDLNGRALYRISQILAGTAPRKDAVAAANGTYRVSFSVVFYDPSMMVPVDTILDTFRYSGISIEVTYGGVADLLTTVGTATMTASMDMEIVRTRGRLPPRARPKLYTTYGYIQPVDASVTTQINIPRATDLAYRKLFAHACSAGTSGVPFSGVLADDVQALETIIGGERTVADRRIHELIQDDNRLRYGLESPPVGFTVFDFDRDGSINSALWSAEFPELIYKWTNKAGVASGDLVTLGYLGLRTLK